MCADLVNTRNAGLRRNSVERPTQGSHLRRPWQLRNPKKRMDLPDPLTPFFKPMRSVRPVEAPGKSDGLPLFKPSLKIQRDPHNQNSAVTVAPVSTVLHRACCLKGLPQSRYFFEGWAFGSEAGVATDSAGILATDCWRASNFSVSVAICMESFFVSACWAASWS